MKLAASNIGWSMTDEADALACLRSNGFSGVEVAPARIWPGWSGATPRTARSEAARFTLEGFEVPALQGILFGKPECKFFGCAAERRSLADHLLHVADLAEAFGASVAVLGAPRARQRGAMPYREALSSAAEFLAPISRAFHEREVILGIEPNPPHYGCDFLTNTEEAAELIALLDKDGSGAGVGLHLDAAGIHLAGEPAQTAVSRAGARLVHCHASEPGLGGFQAPEVHHEALGDALRSLSTYGGWVSLEMREQPLPLKALASALSTVQGCYGDRQR